MTGSLVGASTRSASTVTAKVWKPDRSSSTGITTTPASFGSKVADIHRRAVGADQPQHVQLVCVEGVRIGDHERRAGSCRVDHVAASGGSLDRMRGLAGGDGVRHGSQRLLLLVELGRGRQAPDPDRNQRHHRGHGQRAGHVRRQPIQPAAARGWWFLGRRDRRRQPRRGPAAPPPRSPSGGRAGRPTAGSDPGWRPGPHRPQAGSGARHAAPGRWPGARARRAARQRPPRQGPAARPGRRRRRSAYCSVIGPPAPPAAARGRR